MEIHKLWNETIVFGHRAYLLQSLDLTHVYVHPLGKLLSTLKNYVIHKI